MKKVFLAAAAAVVFSLPAMANVNISGETPEWQQTCMATGWLDEKCVKVLYPEDYKRLTFQPTDLSFAKDPLALPADLSFVALPRMLPVNLETVPLD